MASNQDSMEAESEEIIEETSDEEEVVKKKPKLGTDDSDKPKQRRAVFWAMTFQTEYIMQCDIEEVYNRNHNIEYYIISQPHETCNNKNKPEHFHSFVKAKKAIRMSNFPDHIFHPYKTFCRPLEKQDKKNIHHAAACYVKYIKAKGPNYHEYGVMPKEIRKYYNEAKDVNMDRRRKDRRDVMRDIWQDIKAGQKRRVILDKYPDMHSDVKSLWMSREPPRRVSDTECIFLTGPTGVGKSTVVRHCMEIIKEKHDIDYHFEGQGVQKWMQGFIGDEEILVIDDPTMTGQDVERMGENSQMLKSLISPGL